MCWNACVRKHSFQGSTKPGSVSICLFNIHPSHLFVHSFCFVSQQIDNETQKNTGNNLERITADYKQMKEENSGLAKKLKAHKSWKFDPQKLLRIYNRKS